MTRQAIHLAAAMKTGPLFIRKYPSLLDSARYFHSARLQYDLVQSSRGLVYIVCERRQEARIRDATLRGGRIYPCRWVASGYWCRLCVVPDQFAARLLVRSSSSSRISRSTQTTKTGAVLRMFPWLHGMGHGMGMGGHRVLRTLCPIASLLE